MSTVASSPIYDELLELLADSADADRLLAFRLPAEKQARLDELLQKNRDGQMTDTERGELDEFERLEHVGRLLKARLRQKQKR